MVTDGHVTIIINNIYKYNYLHCLKLSSNSKSET